MVDAVVIGAGHNGLVAATLLARAGWSVEVLERAPVAGGAIGSDTTDRGYVHDWGSAFYGVLHTSPVLAELGLDRRVDWARTDTPVSAVWDERERAGVMRTTAAQTAAGLGPDGAAWLELGVETDSEGRTLFVQRALFHPRGLAGHAYWWSVWPFHGVVFGGMLANIAGAAHRASSQRRAAARTR